MRRYVSYLPVTSNTDISSYFSVDQVQIVASCENKHSPYASLCNGNDSSRDVRVIADLFTKINVVHYAMVLHIFL